MTSADIAAIALGVVALTLLATLVALVRTIRALRDATEELQQITLPLVREMRQTVSQAQAEFGRVDGLLGTAESITTTVDSASRLAYLAFSPPVVKTLAFGAGASKAARRLRRGSKG